MSRHRGSIGLAAATWCLVVAGVVRAGDASQLDAFTIEPRAFGYQVGDVLQRRIVVQVPEGLALDEASLPRPGARGHALELLALHRQSQAGREELQLDYQVFLAPPSVRTLEMPPLGLRFEGQPRAQAVRIDAWPVTVAPLAPLEVSPRGGLGELQPDAPLPRIATQALRARLWAYAAVAIAVASQHSRWCTALGPGGAVGSAPSRRAWRSLLDCRPRRRRPPGASPASACMRLSNAAGGEVLFEHGIDRFAARRTGVSARCATTCALSSHVAPRSSSATRHERGPAELTTG